MRTLIVSERIGSGEHGSVDTSPWETRPSIAAYEASVIDLCLSSRPRPPFCEETLDGWLPFYSIRGEVERLFGAGGVVILLTSVTYINNRCQYNPSDPAQGRLMAEKTQFHYDDKYRGGFETCYDFLDQRFLYETKLDHMNARAGRACTVVSSSAACRRYLSLVDSFYKTVCGIWKFDGGRTSLDIVVGPDKEGSSLVIESYPARVLAENTVTREPIAAHIKYRKYPGSLVILPAYDSNRLHDKEGRLSILESLHDLAQETYEANLRETGASVARQTWTLQYRTAQAIDAEANVEALQQELNKTQAERDKYDKMLVLLDGYSHQLSEAVEDVFGEQWLGYSVEKTQKGALLDMFVRDKSDGRVLAVEVTGVKSLLRQEDPHLTKFFTYQVDNLEHNQDGLMERMVLVVNTFREDDLKDRTDDISVHVRTAAERNGLCILRSSDLYRLWRDFVGNKRAPRDIFGEIFNTVGVFEYKNPASTASKTG